MSAFAGSFGINLKTSSTVVSRSASLKTVDIPIFHDDQHGTAVVTLAGLLNALRVVDKDIKDVRIVVNGAGAAATAITKLLIACGLDPKKVIMCDSKGALYKGRDGMNKYKTEMVELTNEGMKRF